MILESAKHSWHSNASSVLRHPAKLIAHRTLSFHRHRAIFTKRDPRPLGILPRICAERCRETRELNQLSRKMERLSCSWLKP